MKRGLQCRRSYELEFRSGPRPWYDHQSGHVEEPKEESKLSKEILVTERVRPRSRFRVRSVSDLRQRRGFVHGDVIGLITLDLVLRFIFAGTV
jgi:hypothetical protein